jgi:hypothetical protein
MMIHNALPARGDGQMTEASGLLATLARDIKAYGIFTFSFRGDFYYLFIL